MEYDVLPPDLSFRMTAFIVIVICTAAFMSGLCGFGFSAIGAAILVVLPPSVGVPLLMSLSTATQLLAIYLLKVQMVPLREWGKTWPAGPGPFVLGGLLGAPIGVWLLLVMPAGFLVTCFGVFLVAYATYSVLRRSSFELRERPGMIPVGVGFLGGVLGGFTAFPGAAVVIWTGLTKTSKAAARSIVQPYILSLQIYSLAVLAVSDLSTFSPGFWRLLVVLLPVVLPFTWAGVRVYQTMTSDARARRLTLYLLGGAGFALVIRGSLINGP